MLSSIRMWKKSNLSSNLLPGLCEDPNLTYSYSSEEDLNTSVPVNYFQNSPKSFSSCIRQKALKRNSSHIKHGSTEVSIEEILSEENEALTPQNLDEKIGADREVSKLTNSVRSLHRDPSTYTNTRER